MMNVGCFKLDKDSLKDIKRFFSNKYNVIELNEFSDVYNINIDYLFLLPELHDKKYLEFLSNLEVSKYKKIIVILHYSSTVYKKILKEKNILLFLNVGFTKNDLTRVLNEKLVDDKYDKVIECLKKNHINDNSQGFIFLAEILNSLQSDNALLLENTKDHYNFVAKKHDVTIENVERNIRTSIKTYNNFYETKLTNSQVILALYLELVKEK